MSSITPHRTFAIILLSLFSFALVYQSMHQFENPAEAPVDCKTVEHHFHSDPQTHDCELCDYQVTHWVNAPIIAKPWPQCLAVQEDLYSETARSYQFHPFLHRGPPVV